LDAPGVLHHAIAHGIERDTIFWDVADRNDFIDRLFSLVPNTDKLLFRSPRLDFKKNAQGYVSSASWPLWPEP
jgi:hypothetical protein